MNFFYKYEVDWKRVSVIGGIISIAVIMVLLIYGYFSTQKKAQIEHEEKYEEILEHIAETEDVAGEEEKMYQFIYDHTPYEVDTLDLLVRDTMDTVAYEKNENEGSMAEQENAFFAAFYQALVEGDVNAFLGLLDPYSYIGYINKFDTAEEKEQALANIISAITLDGKMVSLSYSKISTESLLDYRITLKYENGKSRMIELSLDTAAKDQHSHSKHNLFIVTSIEEIVAFKKE